MEIYTLSYELAIRVHQMSLKLPKYELYEEGGQARKSSKAITSCIVEGYGRKRYKPELIKFLTYAHASCDETVVHLNFIKDTDGVNGKQIEDLLAAYDELGRKINKFTQYVEAEWK